jgi:hypothetical protein
MQIRVIHSPSIIVQTPAALMPLDAIPINYLSKKHSDQQTTINGQRSTINDIANHRLFPSLYSYSLYQKAAHQ